MKKNTFYILSLGCAKNLVDSNVLAQLLEEEGLTYAQSSNQAEFLLVNTCGFIHDARQESIDTIKELTEKKKPGQKIIATGCLAERWKESFLKSYPDVHGLIGTRNLADIVPLIRNLKSDKDKQSTAYPAYPALQYSQHASYTAIQGGSSYLKIADGCHRSCAFCAIPGIKGSLVSRDVESILRDARFLSDSGVKEINLIAQDLTSYGIDRNEKNGLANLLKAFIAEIPEVPWLRLLYTYPGMINDELINLMAESSQILPYLDIPLQHADPAVLQAMRRPSDIDWVRKTIAKMRGLIPNLVVRTTFIVGFPNETEESFRMLKDFVTEIGFDHLGVFTYSPEIGTAAEPLGDPIPETIKNARRDELMALQAELAQIKTSHLVGTIMDVLVEGSDPKQGIIIGRTYRDAPEIDGLVVASGSGQPGEMVKVKIENTGPYDLFGTQV